tara:strand:- start:732 stop:1544 length:813 start_codon:yes stop_codon:yes gene_type:complete
MGSHHHPARLVALAAIAAVAIGIFLAQPPMAQNPAFHLFADSRALCGLANFWNVASNLPFAAIGLAGLAVVLYRRRYARSDERLALVPLACFFAGVSLVAAGSAHYHADPNNETLFWDRLPMTLTFGSLLATMLADRVNARFAVRLAFPVLATAGIASLLYWQSSEASGAGDLRPYFLLQALPMLLALALIVLFPKARLLQARHLLTMLALYGLAMACEQHDWQIYRALNGAISGHSVKHALAGLVTLIPLWALLNGRPTAEARPDRGAA